MSNNSNPNYFRLGVFVLTAIGVLIAIILIFGSGQLFKKSFMVETYLKQSVTGLDTGAAVRFRGVKVGQVTLIGLSGDLYERDVPFDKRLQYVVVRMQIFGDKLTERQIEDFVKNNLRARVKSMGIKDPKRVYTAQDLAPGEQIIFAACGVTDGALLHGVRFFGDGCRTHTLAMTYTIRSVRFVDTVHLSKRPGKTGVRLY